MRLTTKLFGALSVLMLATNASAWTVNCGTQSIYYQSGATFKSSGNSFYFESGSTMISQGGTAYFEDGSTFKSQGDTVYYNSGSTLKSQGGTYYYEDGSTARSQSGVLYRQDGSRTEVPFSIQQQLGAGITSSVQVEANSDAASHITGTVALGRGETISFQVTPNGITCRGIGSTTNFLVVGPAGSADVQVNPGHDADAIRQQIQAILDRN
jgi:hypothetical protein